MQSFELPPPVRRLWLAQQALREHYAHTGLRFTLDGRLVGDLAEALALQYFDLQLPDRRTPGIDAVTKRGRTVQVKATGQAGKGSAFSEGRGKAEHLLFFILDFPGNQFSVAYNGPEAPIREQLLPPTWTGTKRLDLRQVLEEDRRVRAGERLPMRQDATRARA